MKKFVRGRQLFLLFVAFALIALSLELVFASSFYAALEHVAGEAHAH